MKTKTFLIVNLILILSLFNITFANSKKNQIIEIKTELGNIKLEMFSNLAPKTVENFIGLAEGTKTWTDPKTNKKVKKPFYDGLTFHRVIDDFMIQGGCPLGNGTSGPGYKFADECFVSGKELTGLITTEQVAARVFKEILTPYIKEVSNVDPEIKRIYDDCIRLRSGSPILGKTIEWYLSSTGSTTKLSSNGEITHSVDYGTICMANSGPNTNGSQFFIVTKKVGCSWLNGKHTVFGKVISGMESVLAIEKKGNGVKIKTIRISK